MGTYSEWDEEKRLEFLTRELKGKRPLVPLSIQVKCLLNLNNMIFFYFVIFSLCARCIKLVFGTNLLAHEGEH